MIFNVQVDVGATASSHDEPIDQLLRREAARLQTDRGKGHVLAAACPSGVHVAHVILSLTVGSAHSLALTGARRS